MDLRCETCRFWEGGISEVASLGLCHRYAPRSLARHPIEGPEFLDAVWPRTKEKEWCGEWAAKMEVEGKIQD